MVKTQNKICLKPKFQAFPAYVSFKEQFIDVALSVSKSFFQIIQTDVEKTRI